MWNNFICGIHNLWRWFPIIWRDRDWDWVFLAKIMEQKLRWMVKNSEHWHVLKAPKSRQQMLRTAAVLRRMQEDNNWEHADARYPDHSKAWANHWDMLDKQDMEYLAMMLKKHMRTWWD